MHSADVREMGGMMAAAVLPSWEATQKKEGEKFFGSKPLGEFFFVLSSFPSGRFLFPSLRGLKRPATSF